MSVATELRKKTLMRDAKARIKLLEWRLAKAKDAVWRDMPSLAWAYLDGRRDRPPNESGDSDNG